MKFSIKDFFCAVTLLVAFNWFSLTEYIADYAKLQIKVFYGILWKLLFLPQ